MFAMKKLNTSEDKFFLHKILGISALCNYVYRFGILLVEHDMQLSNYFSMFFLSVHALLSISSFLFKLSNVRNRKIPVIYPEFRFHNMIFSFRSIFCCISFYFFSQYSNSPIVVNMCICFLTMLLADAATKYYATGETKTIRNMPYDETICEKKKELVKDMNSVMQIYATYFMLGNINTSFSPMFAIQFSSFLMTLVKKNLIKPHLWHYLYAMSLWMNFFLIFTMEISFLVKMNIGCFLFYEWRIKRNLNKYVGWSFVFLFHYFLNPSFLDCDFWIFHKNDFQKMAIVLSIIYHYMKYYNSIVECTSN